MITPAEAPIVIDLAPAVMQLAESFFYLALITVVFDAVKWVIDFPRRSR